MIPTMTPEESKLYERFKIQRDSQAAAMQVIKDMHLAANAETAEKSVSLLSSLLIRYGTDGRETAPFPEELLDQMRSCHNAATEFLRQYWSAILPSPLGSLGAGTPSQAPAVKVAKATKMAGYLASMESKMNAVVELSFSFQVDPLRVRAVSLRLIVLHGIMCSIPLLTFYANP